MFSVPIVPGPLHALILGPAVCAFHSMAAATPSCEILVLCHVGGEAGLDALTYNRKGERKEP